MRKLLALTLSLLMVFSLVPAAMVSAEGETYLTMFDASSETASSQIGSGNIGGKVTIVDLENEEHPKAFYVKRTNEWNGFAGAFTGDIRSVAKGVIGIRFWVAGDAATVAAGQKFSAGIGTDSKYYKSTSDVNNNFGPLTSEGAYYTWMLNTGNVYVNRGTFQGHYEATAAKTAITEKFLATAKTRIFLGTGQYGNTEKQKGYQAGLYVDDIELIYPAGVTPAPIEFTATFVGTETAVLTEEVASVKSDVANNDAVVMPEATLTEGTLAGWALNGDFTKLYAPGEVVNISGNVTFYAVNANKPVLATPAAPIADTVSGATVTLKAVTGAVYSKDGATWQTSNKFEGLTPGATYTFYQKMSETLEYAESAVSEGLTVKTRVEYTYEAENCSPIGYKAGTTTAHTISNTYNTADGGVDYKYVQDNNTNAVGAKNVFTVKNLPTGIFTLTTYARNVVNSRSSYEITLVDANGEVVGNFGVVNFADQTHKFPGASYHSANYLPEEVTIAEEGTYKLVFTNVKAGSTGMCLDSFTFKKIADYSVTEAKVKIDGEVVAVLEPGATYTIPTPATGFYYTDGETDYYGGEEVVVERYLNLTTKVLTTKVVYTMDEGSRMVGASTANIGYGKEGAEYLDVDGDMKLALKVKSDQRSAFQLPGNWSNKPYYKPVKITFEVSKNVDASVAFKNMAFSSALGSYNATAGDVYTIFNSITNTPMTVSINVTEDMYDYKYITGQYYAAASWSESAPVYTYIDNVTVTYEYDFDYVAPTEATITIDGEVAATVMTGDTYTLPALEAGKYYVGYEGVSEVVITGDLNLTTATCTYDITVDGEVVATVDYGTVYTLPTLAEGKYYVETEETTFTVTEDKAFTTATYKYDITIDGEVKATVEHGATYTLPQLPISKYYVGVTEKTFTVTSALTFTTANKDAVDSLLVYDADANGKTGAIAMWSGGKTATHADRLALYFGRGDYMSCGGAGVSDVNMFGSFADYADTAIGVRFWAAAASDEVTNNLKVYIGAPENLSDNFTRETLAGETVTVPGTTWTQYTVLFNDNITPEDIASMTHILFTTLEKDVRHYVDDVELLVSTDVDSAYDITIDGAVVDTVEHNSIYTLPALEAGKYYVDGYEAGQEFTVTEALSFTTATYTYDITVDGEVVATVEYGTEYTLPALADGKYYVDVTETTFVVTEALSFTTATYTYDITIDGVVVATVAYGETFTLPAAAEGMQYVDGFVAGQEFVVTEALSFATEKIPEIAGETTSVVLTDAKASIRLNEKTGIRFYTTIDVDAFNALVEGKDYEIGTLIGPKDLVGDYLTVEDEVAQNAVKVTYDMTNGLYDGKFVVGSLVDIKEKNIARDFVARAYVLVDGVYYYSAAQSVRSLAYVADAFVNDPTSNYATLDADIQTLVDAWASKFNG